MLDPLVLRSSSFAQPLPASLERRRAIGYRRLGDGWAPVPRVWFNDAPAGAFFTTAADMARLLTALLEEDTGDSAWARVRKRILQPAFTNHPSLPGLTLGLMERWDGPLRSLEHGGDWEDYSAQIALLPSARLGLFVVFNTGDGSVVAERLWLALLGLASVAPKPARGTGVPAPSVAGTYRLNRYSRSTLARIGILIGAIPELVASTGSGMPRLSGRPLERLDTLLYRETATGRLVGFRTGAHGLSTHLFREREPFWAYERVRWYERRGLHRALFAGLIIGLCWTAVVGIRRARAGHAAPSRLGWLAPAFALSALLYLAALTVALSMIDPTEFQFGPPEPVRWILLWSIVLVALAASVVIAAVRVGLRSWLRDDLPLLHTAYALIAVGVVGFLYYWRLIWTPG